MNGNIKISAFIITLGMMITACGKTKDSKPMPESHGTATIHVSNKAGGQPLTLDSGQYMTAHGDSISISQFSYYLSNLALNSSGGQSYHESNSYHLLLQSTPSSLDFTLDSIPAGTYQSISFMIGVDSLHNVSGAQTGALNPLNDMFWAWNTGYIMARLQGFSPQSGAAGHTITYDIGGYSGTDNALHTITLQFPQPLIIQAGSTSSISMSADALKWFQPAIIDVQKVYTVMTVNDDSRTIADNYSNMFTVDTVKD